MGQTEDAYKLMFQTQFPSWLYPRVTQGATTIWEHWDSYTEEKGFGGQNAMNSFNHYSSGKRAFLDVSGDPGDSEKMRSVRDMSIFC